MSNSSPRDLFSNQMEPIKKVVLVIKGIVPSFKTGKSAFAWKDKASGKIMARPVTLPEHREWMKEATQNFVSQLRSTFQIKDGAMRMDASLRSLIASLPPDDCWTALPEIHVKSELCQPGQERAELIIERIS